MSSTVKPDAKMWSIKEQIVEDLPTGITLQFELNPRGEPRLHLFGEFPFGNRDIYFTLDGTCDGGGTSTSGLCRPAWLTEVDGSET